MSVSVDAVFGKISLFDTFVTLSSLIFHGSE